MRRWRRRRLRVATGRRPVAAVGLARAIRRPGRGSGATTRAGAGRGRSTRSATGSDARDLTSSPAGRADQRTKRRSWCHGRRFARRAAEAEADDGSRPARPPVRPPGGRPGDICRRVTEPGNDRSRRALRPPVRPPGDRTRERESMTNRSFVCSVVGRQDAARRGPVTTHPYPSRPERKYPLGDGGLAPYTVPKPVGPGPPEHPRQAWGRPRHNRALPMRRTVREPVKQAEDAAFVDLIACERDCRNCSYAAALDCDGNCGVCPHNSYCPCVNPVVARSKTALRLIELRPLLLQDLQGRN